MKNKFNNQSGFVLIHFVGQLLFLFLIIVGLGKSFNIGFFDKEIFTYLITGSIVLLIILFALVWLPVNFKKKK
jgi:hypothetical protein|tara:strand:- start:285 stop:503 length:219 start_codon:yes stop_codon:yes gene_type:complete